MMWLQFSVLHQDKASLMAIISASCAELQKSFIVMPFSQLPSVARHTPAKPVAPVRGQNALH